MLWKNLRDTFTLVLRGKSSWEYFLEEMIWVSKRSRISLDKEGLEGHPGLGEKHMQRDRNIKQHNLKITPSSSLLPWLKCERDEERLLGDAASEVKSDQE